MGTLYLVATPIGNLEDITARALRTLREVALIAAEDTRRTRQLLTHFDIHTPLTSYFEHNKIAKLDEVLTALAGGDVALVSDAGTPALSDPGVELVQVALSAGHAVTPIPGACAAISALVASGLPTHAFTFAGFLPRQPAERRAALLALRDQPATLIFYEAPHRLLETLADLSAVLGDRPVAVARELTKRHEEIFRGTARAAHAHFAAGEILGEITLIVAGAPPVTVERWPVDRVRAALQAQLRAGLKPKAAARAVAELAAWPPREVYALLVTDSA